MEIAGVDLFGLEIERLKLHLRYDDWWIRLSQRDSVSLAVP